MSTFQITSNKIKREEQISKFQDPTCGAFVTFEGWVRNHHMNKPVSHLIYETYEELAIFEGQKIISQAVNDYEIASAHCVHAVGELAIGDMAIWIGVNSAHRAPAFEACQFIIDQIKVHVPIWKKEFYTNNEQDIWIHPTS